jgi:type VI secretion system FHA domain protein
MTLVLRGISLNEQPLSQPLIGRFDERGGTVGRSDGATLTLPDPERMISRLHANVLHRDDDYWLENISAASPILHNGRALSTGMRVILREGDEIRVGGYVLEAAFEDDDASATILRGRTVVPNLKERPATPRSSPSTPEPPPHLASTLAEPLSGSVRSAFAELQGQAQPPAQAQPHGQIPPPGQAQPPGPAPHAPDNAAELWRAFLEGCGVNVPTQAPSPALMKSIGEMLKIAVGGIQSLVTLRARAKSEMQADMTLMQPRNNNPLKFSPDSALALQMILQPAARGFLEGPQALRDALTDLQSHQVGMTAGMRSVFEAVLERLDPGKIEALPDTASVLDRLNPGRRKARLWEIYLEEYRSLREEAQDNFQRYFGEALREAYEAQVRNLDAASDAEDPEPDAGGSLKPKGKPR